MATGPRADHSKSRTAAPAWGLFTLHCRFASGKRLWAQALLHSIQPIPPVAPITSLFTPFEDIISLPNGMNYTRLLLHPNTLQII